MKIIRKFLVFILGIFLFGLCISLVLSFAVKEIFQKNIVTALVQESAIPIIKQNTELSKEQEEQLEMLFQDEEVNTLVEDIMDEVLEQITSADGQIDPKVVENIFDYVVENKSKLEEITGEKIDISEIENIKNSSDYQEFAKELTNSLNEAASEMDGESKAIIEAYSFFTSNEFKTYVIGLILLDLLFIALIQWSLYKWVAILGRAMTTTGIMLLLFSVAAGYLIEEILKEEKINIKIDISNLTKMAIITLVVGIVLIIIYHIIKAIVKNSKKNDSIDDYYNNDSIDTTNTTQNQINQTNYAGNDNDNNSDVDSDSNTDSDTDSGD